jgi:hypothetical protein
MTTLPVASGSGEIGRIPRENAGIEGSASPCYDASGPSPASDAAQAMLRRQPVPGG